MKIEIFTLCDYAQNPGGKLTIIGTFDTMLAREFPSRHQQISLVLRLRFDLWEQNTHSIRIETKNLNGDKFIEPIEGTLEVRSTGNATTAFSLVFTVANLEFKAPDVINFVLYIDGKEEGSTPLYVRKT